MSPSKFINPLKFTLVALFVLSIVSACSMATPARTPEATIALEQTQAPMATQTALPTATPQPKTALVGFGDGVSPNSSVIQEVVQELAAQSGMQVEQFPDLAAAQGLAGMQVLVVSASSEGIDGFAGEYPSTQILVVGETDLQPGANLSLLHSQGDQTDQKGFIAGYMASVITQDWRVGLIVQADSPASEALRTGFNNGIVFYCGLCRPNYPPFYTYPVVSELPANSSQETQQAAADVLIASAVETVYVEGAVAEQSLLDYLAEAGIHIIADQPPSPAAQGQWVATIQADFSETLRSAWERIMAGESGFKLTAPLTVQYSNEEWLGVGRLRLVEEIIDNLYNGFIGTGVEIGE